MTSRTVVLRTLAKSWSEVKGVNPVIKKWSLQEMFYYCVNIGQDHVYLTLELESEVQ